MWRPAAGVIVGYIAMSVFVLVTFTIAYLAMGTDKAFKPGSFDVSLPWVLTSIVLGLIAAVIGGLVCALIAAPGSKAPMVLAGLVLVLGLAMAVPVIMGGDQDAPSERSGELDNLEAMRDAKQPPWVALLNPVIGAIGVVAGARMRGKGPAAPEG